MAVKDLLIEALTLCNEIKAEVAVTHHNVIKLQGILQELKKHHGLTQLPPHEPPLNEAEEREHKRLKAIYQFRGTETASLGNWGELDETGSQDVKDEICALPTVPMWRPPKCEAPACASSSNVPQFEASQPLAPVVDPPQDSQLPASVGDGGQVEPTLVNS